MKSPDPMKRHYRCTSCYLKGQQYMHPLARFGVNFQWQFEPCFLRQGSWTRCKTCSNQQGVPTHGSQTRNNDEIGSIGPSSAVDNVCVICSEKWPGRELHVDCHICDGACGKEYPRAHWTVDILKKHRKDKTKKLVCRECTEKGCSAKDVKLYHCVGCDNHLGH